MPAMEAMACGCALVTTDTGGCRDYAINGETALVAAQKDAEGLATHLVALHDHRGKLRSIRDAGRRKIKTFKWQDAADRMERLFAEACGCDTNAPARHADAIAIR